MIDVPHFKVPLEVQTNPDGSTSFVMLEQDTEDEILQCARVVLMYPRGFRPELPEFGLPDQVFGVGGVSLEEIESTVRQWEPRVDLETTQQVDDLVTTVNARAKVQADG